jgi:hypothetical protein
MERPALPAVSPCAMFRESRMLKSFLIVVLVVGTAALFGSLGGCTVHEEKTVSPTVVGPDNSRSTTTTTHFGF